MSHATYDKWVATVLCEKIEAVDPKRVVAWRDDRDIDGGEQIPDKIREAIKQCDEFVVLLTPTSIARGWVQIEIGAAWGLTRRIVPIFYHVDDNLVPDVIRQLKGFQLNDIDAYLNGLKERIKKK